MDRRAFLHGGARAGVVAAAWAAGPVRAAEPPRLRAIGRDGATVPVVGLGTWLSFDIASGDPEALARRREVLQAFVDGGGRLVDSSPMYGRSEATLGELLRELPAAATVYCATKVWTPLGDYGPVQMRRSLALWGRPRGDLMQVHNLLAWQAHLPTLRRWRAEGRVRHLGITTSHGRQHDEVAELLRREGHDLDVLQITYNPADRRAEPLLQQAAARGLAVIANRPFDGGAVLRRLSGVPLPSWAGELGCTAWAPLVLKWELAHPALACVIPATTDPAHLRENLQALRGPLPDAAQRAALTTLFDRTLA